MIASLMLLNSAYATGFTGAASGTPAAQMQFDIQIASDSVLSCTLTPGAANPGLFDDPGAISPETANGTYGEGGVLAGTGLQGWPSPSAGPITNWYVGGQGTLSCDASGNPSAIQVDAAATGGADAFFHVGWDDLSSTAPSFGVPSTGVGVPVLSLTPSVPEDVTLGADVLPSAPSSLVTSLVLSFTAAP